MRFLKRVLTRLVDQHAGVGFIAFVSAVLFELLRHSPLFAPEHATAIAWTVSLSVGIALLVLLFKQRA